MKHLAVIGLQRSGTTWTQHLLQRNVTGGNYIGITAHFKRNNPAWKSDASKHSPYYHWGEPVDLVVPHKNPFAWLKSIHPWWVRSERSRVSSQDFSQFLRLPAKVPGRYRSPEYADGPGDWTHANPIVYWNNVMRDWLECNLVGEDTATLIAYHDLLKDPKGTLKDALEPLGLKVADNFDPVGNTAVGSGGLAGNQFLKRDFYLNEDYYNSYLLEDMDFINSQLDTDLCKELGYTKYL